MGFCRSVEGSPTRTCVQFCDWEAAYAVAFYGADPPSELLPCPAGTNCFAESAIDPATGIRSGDLSYCVDGAASDPASPTTCSLVTGRLLSNPSLTCAEAGFGNGRCELALLEGGLAANGSLIGACISDRAAVSLATWDACDPIDMREACPEGTLCEHPDVFESAPVMATRCVPYCDTAHPLGPEAHCADQGALPTADGTPMCQSMSLLFLPGGPLDIQPTRLGLCGL